MNKIEGPVTALQVCLEQAGGLLRKSQFAEAETLLRLASLTAFGSAQIHERYGVSLELQGHLTEAAQHYRAALVFDPGYRPALRGLERATAWPYHPAELDQVLPEDAAG